MNEHEPSRTAILVAAGVVLGSQTNGLLGILPPEAAEVSRELLGATAAGRRLLAWVDSRVGRAALCLVERATIPGLVAHWVCRKRWIEESWTTARADGFDTLLTLGSGLDTLSIRVSRRAEPGVRAVDVDHPATLAARRRGLERLGDPATLPRLIPHNLSNRGLQRSLRDIIEPASNVFIVIEGVLMYLSEQRVDELFAEIAALPVERVRIAFTFMEARPGQRIAFTPRSRLVDAWLHARSEPFQSGLDPDTLSRWATDRGFVASEVTRIPGHERARERTVLGECAALVDRTRAAH